jgi:ABC-type glycerol-3-phosphate transport system substrate-binding protein
VEQAKKLTFTSEAGTRVVGMILASDLAVFPVMFARAFGGDFISADFKVLPNPEAMEKGLAVLADLFQAGALPRSYANTRNDDMVTWLQQGRAAFGVLPFARFAQLNNSEQSSVPGKIKAIEFPGSATLPAGTSMAAVVESWAMAIPANSVDKDLSWSFIKAVSSKAVTLGAARNGNGPVRVSTYVDADFAASQPLTTISRFKSTLVGSVLTRGRQLLSRSEAGIGQNWPNVASPRAEGPPPLNSPSKRCVMARRMELPDRASAPYRQCVGSTGSPREHRYDRERA